MLNSDQKTVLSEIDNMGDSLITRAVDWCHINSGSYHLAGLERMRDVFVDAYGVLPGTVTLRPLRPTHTIGRDGTRQDHQPPEGIQITVRPDAPIQVVMTGHYDTVYPADSHFQRVKTRDDGALHGPGIADMKGGLSVMLGALQAFEHHPKADQVGYTILISPDEEIGSHSSRPLLMELGAKAHLGLTYEPALLGGILAAGRKGSGNFSLIFRGKSAHAGRAFHEGKHALAAAARAAVMLHELNGKRETVTVNVGRIDGGGALNAVPDLGITRIDVRVLDQADTQWAQAQFERILAEAAEAEGVECELFGGFTRPAKPFSPSQQALFKAAKDAGDTLGINVSWENSGGVCEGNNLYAAGCPNIDSLGVRGGDIHSPAEYAFPDSFAERAKLSALMLCRIAEGTIDAHGLRKMRDQEMQNAAG